MLVIIYLQKNKHACTTVIVTAVTEIFLYKVYLLYHWFISDPHLTLLRLVMGYDFECGIQRYHYKNINVASIVFTLLLIMLGLLN